MTDDRQHDEELKQQFWEALADSPYLFLQLDDHPETAVPMTAALDENARGRPAREGFADELGIFPRHDFEE